MDHALLDIIDQYETWIAACERACDRAADEGRAAVANFYLGQVAAYRKVVLNLGRLLDVYATTKED